MAKIPIRHEELTKIAITVALTVIVTKVLESLIEAKKTKPDVPGMTL